MPTRRAIRKKMARKFSPGDVVTWGRGIIAHRVARVRPDGVIVRIEDPSRDLGYRTGSGPVELFIAFAPASRSYRCPGPPRHSDLTPDVPRREGSRERSSVGSR